MAIYMTRPVTGGIYYKASLGEISMTRDFETWITIADKNAGAIEPYTYGAELTPDNCGAYFQWGNNYGFPRDSGATINTDANQVDASSFGPGNYYSSDTYITVNTWDSSDNRNLWGNESGQPAQGPCDIGFHIPTQTDINLLSSFMNSLNPLGTSEKTKLIQQKLKIPPSGIRLIDGTVDGQGSSTFLWSINRSSSTSANRLDGNGTTTLANISYGLSIRPFKDEAVEPDSSRATLFEFT